MTISTKHGVRTKRSNGMDDGGKTGRVDRVGRGTKHRDRVARWIALVGTRATQHRAGVKRAMEQITVSETSETRSYVP